MIEYLKTLDSELFLFLNGLNNNFFDFLMFWLSNKFIWIPLYVFFLFLIFKHFKKQWWIILIIIILGVVLSDQLSVLIKNYFQRYRPSHNTEISQLVHIVNGHRGGKYGFVSSHASNCFFLASFLSFLFKKNIKYFSICIFSWATLISYSRIYLGVHYPGDVFCGALLGISIASILYYCFYLINKYFLPSKKIT